MLKMYVETLKMKKGNLVRLDKNQPEIKRCSEFLSDPGHAKYRASRPTTFEEQRDWRESKSREIAHAREAGEDTFHIAFDSGGESRLAPRSVSIPLSVDGIFIVEKARCRVSLGWGNPTGGMAKILDTTTGEIAFVKRDLLEVVEK